MRLLRNLLLLALPLLLATGLRAQAVRWDPPGGNLGLNQVTGLSLVFEECEPRDDVTPPTVDGLKFGTNVSRSSQTSIVNFQMTRSVTLTFPAQAMRRGKITIPSFEVATDKGRLAVPAVTYTVGDATVGSSGIALDQLATAELTSPRNSVWAGEVFPLTYTLTAVRRYLNGLGSLVEWKPDPLIAEDWSKPESGETVRRGERCALVLQRTRAMAREAGDTTLPTTNQLLNIIVGQSNYGFFAQPSIEQHVIASQPLPLKVKPLPPAPAGFSGAVGQFQLTSKVVPAQAGIGEPVTWTLELSGTGNWPDIAALPARQASTDFSVVQPKARRVMKDNSLFEGTLTEDAVLVPTRPGKHTLPAVKFTYFDPEAGTYKTLTTEAATVEISGTAAAASTPAPVQFSLNSPSPATPGPSTALPPVVSHTTTPDAPGSLPRDPLPSGATGRPPVHFSLLVILCLCVATGLPLLLWLTLAARRARALDPQRPRRLARHDLTALLAAAHSDFNAQRDLVRQWQHLTAVLWQSPHAAPSSFVIHHAVSQFAPSAAPTWTTLWADADRAVHGNDQASLPTDWLDRAKTAVAATRVPRWNPLSLLAPRHLFPSSIAKSVGSGPVLGLVLAVIFLALPNDSRADTSPANAYRQGNFAAAEKDWRTASASAPHDWTLHHNLGLALAQQERWVEASAEWATAFLLAPREPANRWNLQLGLQTSGLAPAGLHELAQGTGAHAWARLASPHEWQQILVLGSVLFATALVLLLLAAYGLLNGWARPAALTCVVLAIALAGGATIALRAYGPLAAPDVVLIWRDTTLRSVPTEADTQKTTPLRVGNIARAERDFLGWTRVNFTGGQSGWVRHEDIRRLYH